MRPRQPLPSSVPTQSSPTSASPIPATHPQSLVGCLPKGRNRVGGLVAGHSRPASSSDEHRRTRIWALLHAQHRSHLLRLMWWHQHRAGTGARYSFSTQVRSSGIERLPF
ncbi:hypothetical protein NDU88_002318 [Pleurodeles waltl]|uniref:Uncharacterized protein n=1 Tax=Pleurodeles waltl TaxID=8319 RepID=A0AAV7UAF0_PLEWA|nr:hypothetical protein NDU88_002318 [Pleurodeles waltl]